MSSLADQIIESNAAKLGNVDPDVEIDDLGLPIYQRPDYVVARILKRNTVRYHAGDEGLLHLRQDMIYLGNQLMPETKGTLLKLACMNMSIKPQWVQPIYELLRELLPVLDESKVAIDKYSYWDKEKGMLVKSEKPILHI